MDVSTGGAGPEASGSATFVRSKRRGLATVVAGVFGLAMAQLTTRRANAANGDPLAAGNTTMATSTTGLTAGLSTPVFEASNSDGGPGLHGVGGPGVGVQGDSNSNSGVYGNSTSGYGVLGTSAGAPALSGSSVNNVGVYGNSGASYGILGTSTAVAGLAGDANSAYGVFGNSTNNNGVYGQSRSAAGVSGFSGSGNGVEGRANAAGIGVYGQSTSGDAGYFDGPVFVNGGWTVTGVKSAVVPHPDGTHRRLYCLESPESFFEDFGRGEVSDGAGHVDLDPEFAAVVNSTEYDVYLTPYGDSRGLYVTERGPTGFAVREQQGGHSHLSFGYRVLVRRADVRAPRLEKTLVKPVQRPVDLPRPRRPLDVVKLPATPRLPVPHPAPVSD